MILLSNTNSCSIVTTTNLRFQTAQKWAVMAVVPQTGNGHMTAIEAHEKKTSMDHGPTESGPSWSNILRDLHPMFFMVTIN